MRGASTIILVSCIMEVNAAFPSAPNGLRGPLQQLNAPLNKQGFPYIFPSQPGYPNPAEAAAVARAMTPISSEGPASSIDDDMTRRHALGVGALASLGLVLPASAGDFDDIAGLYEKGVANNKGFLGTSKLDKSNEAAGGYDAPPSLNAAPKKASVIAARAGPKGGTPAKAPPKKAEAPAGGNPLSGLLGGFGVKLDSDVNSPNQIVLISAAALVSVFVLFAVLRFQRRTPIKKDEPFMEPFMAA